jgi:hypothetical protein
MRHAQVLFDGHSRETRFAEVVACLRLDACADRARPTPRPDLAGRRLRMPGQRGVYLVDPAGYRRHVPDVATYERLFRSWDGIATLPDVDELPDRPPLGDGTMLVRGDATGAVYVIDQGRKRRIASPHTMDKYWFDWSRVCPVRQVLVDHFSCGNHWE